jgi:diguanylate cyclase
MPHSVIFTRSLRFRVLILLALIFGVVLSVATYRALERRKSDLANATERLQLHAQLIVEQQSAAVHHTEQFIETISGTGELGGLAADPKCAETLQRYIQQNPRFSSILIVDAAGDYLCGSLPASAAANYSDRSYFQKALAGFDTVVGEAILGRLSKRWVIPFAKSLRYKAGVASGVVIVSLDLEWISRELSRGKYPSNTTLGLIDGAGTILARYPDYEKFVGKSGKDFPGFKALTTLGGEGSAVTVSHDGVARIFVFAEFLKTAGNPIYLWIGLPTDSVTASADHQFVQALAITLVLVISTFALAWLACTRYLIAPIEAIANAARKLSQGDYQARTQLEYEKDEIGSLARIFDSMAQSLTSKAELLRMNRALRVVSSFNKILVRAQDERQLLKDACVVIVEAGGYHMAWIGLAYDDAKKTILPVAYCGHEEGYLSAVEMTWDDFGKERGPTGTAIRTKKTSVIHDIYADPATSAWREEAMKLGYRSGIALPLTDRGNAFGALTIYASEPDAFHRDEVALLEELAEDVSFGIMTQRSKVERMMAENRAALLAKFDPLTDLPNRIHLISHIGKAIARAESSGEQFAVMVMSIDRFEDIHDAIGIAGADNILKQIAQRLSTAAGEIHFVARIADSYALVVPLSVEDWTAVAEELHGVMDTPFEYADIRVSVQATIGVALFPDHGIDTDSLLQHADIAIRQARGLGVPYALYSGGTETESTGHLILLTDLRKAIRDGDLTLSYQPKVSVPSLTISGAEALVRWNHGERGAISPVEFIPLAERTGLIKPLTYLVLGIALKQMASWEQSNSAIRIAVNVSPNNLRDPDFFEQLASMPKKFGASLDFLDLEITETALMEDPEKSRELLTRITELGVRVFIDDFGTGYSSLSYLATLPIHALKIDRSFVIRMEQPKYHAIVASTISMAHALGLKVVAEGVETLEQQKILVACGCDEIQGYLYSKPLPAEAFSRWKTSFEQTQAVGAQI